MAGIRFGLVGAITLPCTLDHPPLGSTGRTRRDEASETPTPPHRWPSGADQRGGRLVDLGPDKWLATPQA